MAQDSIFAFYCGTDVEFTAYMRKVDRHLFVCKKCKAKANTGGASNE